MTKSNICRLAGQKDMGFRDLAKRSGISSATLYVWENDGSTSWLKLYRLAKTLGCSMEDLFTVERL
jgi:DNA-binding XRE family transcriptional regulator